MTAQALQERLRGLGDPEKARGAARFFKTGPGEYGEGDCFMGLHAKTVRGIAKEFRALPLAEIAFALQSSWHEERLVALLILVLQYPKADSSAQKAIYD